MSEKYFTVKSGITTANISFYSSIANSYITATYSESNVLTFSGTSGLLLSIADVGDKLQVSGNIAVTGTVDGRDIATDGSKLDGIEAGADVTDANNVNPLIDSHLNTATATTGQVLSWSGTDYSWVTSSGGGTVSTDIYTNNQTITTNYTISATQNGMSTGPIVIDSTITVESGARWVIL